MNLELTTLAQHTDLIPILADWFREAWPEFFSSRDAAEYVAAQANTETMPIALLVLSDGVPVGTVALKERSIDARPDLSPWVAGLYVHPDHRRIGIGQLLVVSATRVAWAMGFERVYAGAQEVELFTAIGWEVIGEEEQSGKSVSVLSVERPEDPPSLYDEIGGEEVVRALVDRFYDLMDELPEAAEVRAMHARSLRSSREKLFEFLSGWLGGPQLYIEKRGHPRLRARHLPFSIGTDARDQWLRCMDQALEETVTDETVREQIANAFSSMADHMRNQSGR